MRLERLSGCVTDMRLLLLQSRAPGSFLIPKQQPERRVRKASAKRRAANKPPETVENRQKG